MDVKIEAFKLFHKKIEELIFFFRRGPKDAVAAFFALLFFYWGLCLYGKDNVIELPLLLEKHQDSLNLYRPFAGIFLMILAIVLIAWVIYRLWKIALPPIIPEYELSHAIKGLMAFNAEDGDLFSKLERNQEVAKICQYINNPQEQIIVLMGESGAGKTSLLCAGLSYILKPKQCTYIYWEAFPGDAEASLLERINTGLDTQYQQLDEVLNHQTKAVIVLDQFEQLSVEKQPAIFKFLRTVIKQSPPHKLTWIVAFRRDYDPEWRDFELSLGDNRYRQLPMLSLKLFSQVQAQNVFTILASEAGLILDQALVDSFISSMQNEGQISPVDISIGLLMLSELASREHITHLGLRDYQFAGGSEGLFVGFIHDKLKRYTETAQQELLKALLELIDSNGYKRKAEGEDLQKLLTVVELPKEQLNYALDYFASSHVRLLEKLPNGFYRLPHETIIPALRRLTGLVLVEVEQASLSLKTAYEAWQKSSKKNSAYLLKGKALRKVLKHLPQIHWQAQDKQTFLKQCLAKRTRQRLLSGSFVLLLSVSGFYSWHAYLVYSYKEALINWGLPADLYDYQIQLEKLAIEDDDIHHLQWLKELPNLKELSLTRTKIKNLNEITEKLTSLTSLDLSKNYKLSSLQGLEKLPALTSLNLSGNQLSRLHGLDKLTTLTKLNLSTNTLSSLQDLEKLTALTSLNLSTNTLSSLQGLDKLTGLTSLDLSGNKLSSLQDLEKLTALTSLNLSGTGTFDFQTLEKLPRLTSLNLSYYLILGNVDTAYYKTTFVKHLNDFSMLTSFLGQNKVTELTSLRLRAINIISLQGLEMLPRLTSLNLSGNQLSSLQGLDKLTALTSLDLASTNLSSLQGLEKLTALTSLNLSDNKLSSLQGLDKLTALTSLNLSGNKLSSLQGLEKLTGLTSLILSDNKLSSLQGLEKLTGLTSLILSDNKLSSLQGLEKLTVLTTLELNSNNMSSLQGLPSSVTVLILVEQDPSIFPKN